MEISLELVPRKREDFEQEILWTRTHIPQISYVNIPDLTRLPTRSWEAFEWVNGQYPVIVHIRASDILPDRVEDFATDLKNRGIRHLLVVQGDERDDGQQGMTSVELLEGLRMWENDFVLYGAIDPYRQDIAKEMRYVEKKILAGAKAFLTQPFFDKKLLTTYHRACEGLSVWWGVTPILSEKSLIYWREKNGVPLPDDYDLSLEGNAAWAATVIEEISGDPNASLYLMPIRVDVQSYLPKIFEKLS
ncbi:methylenetetrahydrofolate reductase [Thermospira aquatica]|uniref:Methylenetetrahydrofolate reductase n=1 Tax=Thermospira aquatica TaxID=2828656 RepID=A0AAX3BG12_9SPIR|nr:methylenetetrahydrofolate reductase [Thermospira aquatica]URA11216.1 methylenetetrahydrofolate reductase [Thermospira aquatica]